MSDDYPLGAECDIDAMMWARYAELFPPPPYTLAAIVAPRLLNQCFPVNGAGNVAGSSTPGLPATPKPPTH